MQHLLLAIAIISLTIIAGNGRGKTPAANGNVTIKLEKPAINTADSELPEDKPSIIFSRFDMFIY
jgi:hypothetical protein